MKKQIILIMTDTQRTDMLGCYGNAGLKTPNLDRLAREGMLFDRAYTCQPVCGPARSAIFTGLFPHSNGVWANSQALGDNVKTVGQRLTDNGIHTAYIGKWHLDGGDYFGLGRCPDGWDKDYWYDMKCYLEELTEEERRKSRKTSTMDEEQLSEDFLFGHRCANRAINYVDKHVDDDFLLVLSFDEPHDPSLCPEPFKSMYDDYEFPKSENVWDTLRDKPEHQRVWAGKRLDIDKDSLKIKTKLFGCNSYADYEIGRVLDKVNQLVPDAMVIYTADHGDMLSSHSLSSKGPAAYDEITRIPLMIKCNGLTKAGSVYQHPVSHIDMVPTMMEYMGLPIPKLLEGKSILPALKDCSRRVNEHIFIEFGRYEIDHDGFGGFQPLRCVFDGRYKLCINLLTSDELYDIQNDPGEMKNLILNEEYSEIRNRLHDSLLQWMNDTRDPFRGYYWECRPWRKHAATPTWSYTGYTRQRENEEYEPRQLDYATGVPMEQAIRKK